jgi:hypothetical protein
MAGRFLLGGLRPVMRPPGQYNAEGNAYADGNQEVSGFHAATSFVVFFVVE